MSGLFNSGVSITNYLIMMGEEVYYARKFGTNRKEACHIGMCSRVKGNLVVSSDKIITR